MARSRKKQLAVVGWVVSVAALLGPTVGTAFANFGRGAYGSINDKAVTFAGLSMIAFFPILIFVLNRIDGFREKRRERKEALSHAFTNGHSRGGW